MPQARPLALITGASSGIGYELTRCCVQGGFDAIVVADEPEILNVPQVLFGLGGAIEPIQEDLATPRGVDRLYEAIRARPVDALLANAGRGLGEGFLDQNFTDISRVIDTNVTGTLYLVHKVGRDMRAAGHGRILITGSIAGFMPGSFQAVYNASKAFLDSFAAALRNELKDSGVSVTCLMPGPTETEFFKRANLMDTKIGQEDKMPAADVAKLGYEAMMKGEDSVITGWKNKLEVAMSRITSSERLAEQHRKVTAPDTGKDAH